MEPERVLMIERTSPALPLLVRYLDAGLSMEDAWARVQAVTELGDDGLLVFTTPPAAEVPDGRE